MTLAQHALYEHVAVVVHSDFYGCFFFTSAMVVATLSILSFTCLWLSMAFLHGNSFMTPVVQQCMKLQTPGKIFHGASISASVAKHLELIGRFPMVPSSAD